MHDQEQNWILKKERSNAVDKKLYFQLKVVANNDSLLLHTYKCGQNIVTAVDSGFLSSSLRCTTADT